MIIKGNKVSWLLISISFLRLKYKNETKKEFLADMQFFFEKETSTQLTSKFM